MALGDNIKSRRKALNLTGEELGNRVGCTKTTVSKYEKGQLTNMPSDTLKRFAAALDTTPGYLMGWEDIDGNPYSVPEPLPISNEDLELIRATRNGRKLSLERKQDLLRLLRFTYPELFN